MIKFYNRWNKDGAKKFQVVQVNYDRRVVDFARSFAGCPWVALPYETTLYLKDGIKGVIPVNGYPTAGVIDGTTGVMMEEDIYGNLNDETLNELMEQTKIYSLDTSCPRWGKEA